MQIVVASFIFHALILYESIYNSAPHSQFFYKGEYIERNLFNFKSK